MVASALALSLIGISAVQALPTSKTVTRRQIWLGDGSTVLIPGSEETPPQCLVDLDGKPIKQQPPCLLPPITGPIQPSTKKRQASKRQVIIGDPTTIFIPGQGEFPVCLVDVPLKEQPPCLLLPIPGEITPSTKKRQAIIGDPTTVFVPGVGEVPVCLGYQAL
ncbi:hypothetical protein VTJ49DRAFT_3442 [Mycothermus thermophilus]|uniref:Uncharacterized protein n=1 Tax=Humicola insolens TaxID=85995 RepID=A0ABR3V7J5_HUMIN